MGFPDREHFGLFDHVAPEPGTPAGRIVLWVAGTGTEGTRRWERIADLAGPEIDARGDFCATAVLLTPLEEKRLTFWQALLRRIRPDAVAVDWVAPDGTPAQRSGEKRTDLLLVWSGNAGDAQDEAQIREHWPGLKEFRPLGTNLSLFWGVGKRQTSFEANQTRYARERLHAKEDHVAELSRPEYDPRQLAEKMLALAEAGHDVEEQATALIDLGSALIRHGDVDAGIEKLEQGLALARQCGNTAIEYDARANLGIGHSSAGNVAQARKTCQQVLDHARTVGDRFAEKMMLGQLGAVCIILQQPERALEYFEMALQIAQDVGDQRDEAETAWHMGICYDELGQRDRTIECAQAAVDIYQRQGAPQGAAFAEFLERFRRGDIPMTADAPDVATGAGDVPSYLGSGTILAGPTAAAAGLTGRPSPLRMAYSAARSMSRFVASGFKTVSREAREKRLATCGNCQHHTGVRCRVCGCFTAQKSWLPHEHCPIGEWPV